MKYPYIVLLRGRDRNTRRHHPWVYSGAILREPSDLENGETVAVVSNDGDVLGYGSYSPQSQIRVRMLSYDSTVVPSDEFIRNRVAESIARREASLWGDKAALRLIHAESDYLPGVVADWYDGHIVCQFSTAGANYWKKSITTALMELPGAKGVSERKDVDLRLREGLEVSDELEVLAGQEPPEAIEIIENGIHFFVDVRTGHKTGFYLDQRDARAMVAKYAKDREVLNCFCYTGGFGLAAAVGGAKKVTQVDISASALEMAKRNATLMPDKEDRFEYVEADVFSYLRQCRDAGQSFDLIILDPPKFADTKSHLEKAGRGYKDINLCAMKLLRPGGILATFSCSSAMTSELFDKVVHFAAIDLHLNLQILRRTGQASDHPALMAFPEGEYLKGLLLR